MTTSAATFLMMIIVTFDIEMRLFLVIVAADEFSFRRTCSISSSIIIIIVAIIASGMAVAVGTLGSSSSSKYLPFYNSPTRLYTV